MMRKQNVLIVDDTPKNIQLVASILKPLGYGLFFATSGKEALEAAATHEIDLILLDVMMPDMDGFETARLLKEDEIYKEIPIIFLTAKADEDSVEAGFNAGGVDYITKPFHNKELVARVKTHLHISHMARQLQKQAETMQELANTDALTKMPNRLKFNTIYEHQVDLSLRYKKNLSLVFIDIDLFKNVNDTYGHKVGDTVLIEIANMLHACVRASDLAARWGGEEFVIISSETTREQAMQMAEKIRACIEEKDFDTVGHITCSFGVTALQEQDDAHSFLIRADNALYSAKKAGRNCVVTL